LFLAVKSPISYSFAHHRHAKKVHDQCTFMDKPPIVSSEITREAIRRALRAWDSSRELGGQPLAGLRLVAAQRQSAGYSDTAAGWGLALRDVLQSAVQALRPDSGEFDAADKRWRPYFILSEQYIHDRAPEWVSTQLCIARRTYFNEQEDALEAVAELLRQREEQNGLAGTEAVVGSESTRQIPFLAPPKPVHALVGRAAVLHDLKTHLLSGAGHKPLAVYGLPGVGKSSLAIELAHDPQVLAHFTDGVLWVGLGRQPDIPALLNSWAMALGLSADAVKFSDLAASARVIHAVIGIKNMLLIIDDAWNIEQALAFRLGGPNCATLLTTRLGTVAADFAGEGVFHLSELDNAHGLTLLIQMAPQAVSADQEMTHSLVSAVGGLPLALVLMGRHLRKLGQTVQARRLREAVAQLHQVDARLQLAQPQSPLEQRSDLPVDASLSLQTIIGISDAALTQEARQSLRALALFPPKPNTFSEAAALAVSGASLNELDALIDGGLVEGLHPDRYTLHQTISDYARLQGADAQASQRYIAYFAKFVTENASDYQALDAELDNLLAALDMAENCALFGDFLQICQGLHLFLMNRGFYQLDEKQLQRAVGHARQSGNTASLAFLLSRLGLIKSRLGKYAEAQEILKEGMGLAQQLEDEAVEAECLQNLGNLSYYEGEYQKAEEGLDRALALFRKAANLSGEARALNSLGLSAYEQGIYSKAVAYLEQSLQVNRQAGNTENEALTLSNLGLLLADQGNYGQAVEYHQQALKISHKRKCVRLEGAILDNLSFALTQLGQLSEAKACSERALQIFRQVGNQQGIATVLSFLGSLLQTLGDADAALEHCKQSLELAQSLKERYTQGVALTVMGNALADLDRPVEAADSYQQAVDLWQAHDQFHLSTDPLAGLARLALGRGDLPLALRHIEPILAHLENHTLDGVLDPYWTQLTCCKVLQACGDPRYVATLDRTYSQLMEHASKIGSEDLRRSFLERVSTHREILELHGDVPPSGGRKRVL
jgi:tetratricopeptide (TPR) repeat protein